RAGEILGGRIVWREQRRKDRCPSEHQQDDDADHRTLVARERAQLLQRRALRLRRRVLRAADCRRRHRYSLTRGSTTEYSRSVMMLSTMNMAAKTKTMPCTSGKSRLLIDCTSNWPMPGHENTVSVRTAPPSSVPNCRPITVRIGMKALRSACRTATRSGTPLARTVRT